ncbi:hypothetical protein G443_002425 [Actinoalloteichus cyanogriseus DSM 43889]|uniref:CENP-V/GFA domain-containing protein n=1 Tax=Actinoalloteichus caeruleus DSM 43889 TaxID=1120930 RepID=A0ABT1JI15_ACTCY|nr:hypothetical protein [Actinoalloteichus caeruleus DSM 43889]
MDVTLGDEVRSARDRAVLGNGCSCVVGSHEFAVVSVARFASATLRRYECACCDSCRASEVRVRPAVRSHRGSDWPTQVIGVIGEDQPGTLVGELPAPRYAA